MSTSAALGSLRAGIIGTGFIGPVHLEAILKSQRQRKWIKL
jgi:predicted dehydrogenase